MKLKAIYKKKDDIPEEYLALYTEKDGQWELTGVEGVKTQADIDRVKEGLTKEKKDHKETKAKLNAWGGKDPEEEMPKLDKYEELEALAEGKGDKEQVEKIVEGRIKGITGPLEREIGTLKETVATQTNEIATFKTKDIDRKITDSVRKSAIAAKVVPSAIEDIVMVGKNHFHIDDTGLVTTKDDIEGITPGVDATIWMTDMVDKKPHWFPPSEGGNAPGSDGKLKGFPGNPFTKQHWSITDQGRVIKEHGAAKAEQMAKSAGSHVGATTPPEK